jgi:acyl-CoA synthetase (AMP-forming)/AMP-acid ligase II
MTETWGQVATQSPARAGDPTAPLVPLPSITLTAGTRETPAPITILTPTRMTSYLDEARSPQPEAQPTFASRDLGFLDADGCLHVTGRVDDVIITGGENVHPAEVERVLALAPGVAACCVFATPDPRWGQVVCAAIVPAPGFDEAAALAHCAAHLAPHQRPRRLTTLGALPLGPTGKIDRRACAQLTTT